VTERRRPTLRWHEAVVSDLKAIKAEYGPDVVEQARQLVIGLPGDPLLGEWLENQAGTGDLSTCRKVKFGPDEINETGVNFGPALRLVYRLLPSNTNVQQLEILAIGRRRDLEAYGIAAARLHQPEERS
jgi:hypothetical protein